MSSAAEDAWKELQGSGCRPAGVRGSRGGPVDMHALMKKINKSSANKGAATQKEQQLLSHKQKSAQGSMKKKEVVHAAAAKPPDPPADPVVAGLSEEVVLQRFQRDLLCLENEDAATRKRALREMHDLLFTAEEKTVPSVSADRYPELFESSFKALFKTLADPSEKCREESIRLVTSFFQAVPDLTPYMAYFFPALMARMPSSYLYDAELQLFVSDLEEHEAFKRGKATVRQDKGADTAPHKIIEPSEELRLLLCRMLSGLACTLLENGTGSVLHPYFHEVILFLQAQLHDPFPELRIEACGALAMLADHSIYELGMKYYAVALVRAVLPLFRHRLAKVRCAAIEAVRLVVKVPNRDKRKGAGTEAIVDLVGFREDNVLPVAAFYRPDVSINYLAEVAQDATAGVRERVAVLLSDWLLHLPDRYDYETRLLPYLLTFLCDPVPKLQELALATVGKCGEMYEADHADDVIEKRQYGVDGDRRCNHSKPLPPPFTDRPRLGTRLYVRGNTRRILRALLEELCNWISRTRLQSARLLRTIIIFCEEHLVSEVHVMLPYLYKALQLAVSERDQQELADTLLQCAELLGRFVLPSTYVPLFTPRLREEAIETPHGVSEGNKVAVLGVLRAMLEGSQPAEVVQQAQVLVEVLTEPIEAEDGSVWRASAEALVSLLSVLGVQGKAAVSAVFLNTGRLPSLQPTFYRAFRYLAVCRARGCRELGERGLDLLARVEDMPVVPGREREALVRRHADRFVADLVEAAALRPLSAASSLAMVSLQQALEWQPEVLAPHFVVLASLLCDELETTDEAPHLAPALMGLLTKAMAAAAATDGESSCGGEWRPVLDRLLALCLARHHAGSERTLSVLSLLTSPEAAWNPGLALSRARDAAAVLLQPMADLSAPPAVRRLAVLVVAQLLEQCEGQGGLEVARIVSQALQERLDDASPQVAVQACLALHGLLPYLQAAHDQQDGQALGLEGFIESCLSHVPPAEGELRDRLDGLLRLAVMRDLRAARLALEGHRESRDAAEVVGGLIDHVDTILALRGATRSD